MKDSGTSGQEKELSFDLPLENELLMLKLTAEFGAKCIRGEGSIPPKLVNQFLQSVYEFERKFRDSPELIRIHDRIGKPDFRKEEELTDRELASELKRFRRLLRKHRILLEVRGNYSPREIYRFITEEFFAHRIEHLDLPGYTSHFCYEDFHPAHEEDVCQRLFEFLAAWFDRRLDDMGLQLAETFVLPDGRSFSRHEAVLRARLLFEAFPAFINCWYKVDLLDLIFDAEGECKEATVEGFVQYDAIMENGEQVHVEGPLQARLSRNREGWEVCAIELAGFSWCD